MGGCNRDRPSIHARVNAFSGGRRKAGKASGANRRRCPRFRRRSPELDITPSRRNRRVEAKLKCPLLAK